MSDGTYDSVKLTNALLQHKSFNIISQLHRLMFVLNKMRVWQVFKRFLITVASTFIISQTRFPVQGVLDYKTNSCSDRMRRYWQSA